ncbi:transmembrane GTPase fzo1 [Flagelloscypha sp. PMI_526]|nr:transmembrane GTPase fzo1 [Flagelloscypha sp. PMI_526]
MAQAYYSQQNSPVKQTAFTDGVDRPLRVDDVQEAYLEQKDKLVHAIDSTKDILSDLRKFNKDEWVVRYPRLRAAPSGLTHSLSFVDEPAVETEVTLRPKGMARSMTTSSIDSVATSDTDDPAQKVDDDSARLLPSSDFQVLRLDLKLGSHSSASAASALVSQLEKSSIANLLDERLSASVSHIDKLRLRVEDTSSKVLVTGDLNAGKSTFVNALLRREVMPVDQQPCTTAFCEVHDAAENYGVEEVHLVKEGATYDIKDETTFSRFPIQDLESVVGEKDDQEENAPQQLIKLYLGDTRAPSESLLNNGVVDISLIDAPGLNRDSLKTTALFARQEEIDVVVFVVSAENHFTLSAKEFLWNASNEKAYLFIVVNKYDQIKNKDKCRRLVLDQIKQLSPRTYENADELVHFVDSASALQPYTANPSFDDLESSLRSFVLVKRSKSKLHPASTYLSNLLADIELLASANCIVAETELDEARVCLAHSRPVLEKMQKGREGLEDSLETEEEEGASAASASARSSLNDALDRISKGKLPLNSTMSLPSYPGLFGVWEWARDIRRTFLLSLDAAVKAAEDESRIITTQGVEAIKNLGETHLPEGVERSRRVFMPEAMFSTVRARGAKGAKTRRTSGQFNPRQHAIVAGGYAGLGIGLSQRLDMLDTTVLDIMDVNHLFWIHFSDSPSSSSKELVAASAPSALSLLSVGLGALTMVGGHGLSTRGLIEGIVRLTDMVGNDKTRKLIAPIIGAVGLGMGVYLVLELPKTIPRNVGRRVRDQVLHPSTEEEEEEKWTEGHAKRIEKETRKVLRLASWDLKERFRGAMEERSKEVKRGEESEKRAEGAIEWFNGAKIRVEGVRGEIQGV